MKKRKVGFKELTAAGTVADFHGIPYYPQDKYPFWNHLHNKIIY
jgi:hypothetical protein